MKSTSETLNSGKMIVRYIDDGGRVERVVHRYGTSIVFMRIESADGSASEHYMVKGRAVDAKWYAKSAESFGDMPRPSAGDDYEKKAKSVISEEHLHWVRALDENKENLEMGKRIDDSCLGLLSKALPGEGAEWLSRKVIIGDASPSQSRKILRTLYGAGAKSVHLLGAQGSKAEPACIDGLIVELPSSESQRRQILIECDLLSRANGEVGYFDDGQRFTEVRF